MALRQQGEPPGTDGTLKVQPSPAAPGLLLRPWIEQDIPAMVAAHRGSGHAALAPAPGRDRGGSVSIRGLAREATSAEVGYWVTAPSRGRGIAPLALSAICEWAFRLPRIRPLEQLELIHAAGNHASCRVADKAGFALRAVLPPALPDFPDDGHRHIRPAGKHQ